jgi:hypothetical protein
LSDKLIRDEILRSHRYVSLSSDTTKLTFFHLLLSSDSLSNSEATATALSIMMGRVVTEAATATILAELADHDLVRIYEADGKRYVHIPRSRQRIRYLRGKHPRPPTEIEDNEIKDLIAEVGLRSDRGQSQVGPKLPEAKRSVVVVEAKRSEEKQSQRLVRATRLPTDWRLPDEWKDWAVKVHHLDPQRAVRISLAFRDYWIAKPKDATRLDWLATWRNWIRKECQDA